MFFVFEYLKFYINYQLVDEDMGNYITKFEKNNILKK